MSFPPGGLLSSGLGVGIMVLGMGSTLTTLTDGDPPSKTFPMEKSIGSPVPLLLVLLEDEEDLEADVEPISEWSDKPLSFLEELDVDNCRSELGVDSCDDVVDMFKDGGGDCGGLGGRGRGNSEATAKALISLALVS